MTIEEAIKNREECVKYLEGIGTLASPKCLEAVRMSVVALKAQQDPAKLDRSRWEECPDCKGEVFAKRRQYMRPVMEPLTPEQALMDKLTELTGIVYAKVKNEFCHTCGRPLTEEAWAELERRIGGES